MRHAILLILGGALSFSAHATDASPSAATGAAKAASAPAAKANTNKPKGGAPVAGGDGGGVGTNNSNTATHISPKKPKCPDPTKGCPAEQVIAK